MKEKKKKWFSRLIYSEKTSVGLICPSCKKDFPLGAGFDHDYRECLHCKIELREWVTNDIAYLFEYEKSPELIKVISKHLETKDEYMASIEIQELINFLCCQVPQDHKRSF